MNSPSSPLRRASAHGVKLNLPSEPHGDGLTTFQHERFVPGNTVASAPPSPRPAARGRPRWRIRAAQAPSRARKMWSRWKSLRPSAVRGQIGQLVSARLSRVTPRKWTCSWPTHELTERIQPPSSRVLRTKHALGSTRTRVRRCSTCGRKHVVAVRWPSSAKTSYGPQRRRKVAEVDVAGGREHAAIRLPTSDTDPRRLLEEASHAADARRRLVSSSLAHAQRRGPAVAAEEVGDRGRARLEEAELDHERAAAGVRERAQQVVVAREADAAEEGLHRAKGDNAMVVDGTLAVCELGGRRELRTDLGKQVLSASNRCSTDRLARLTARWAPPRPRSSTSCTRRRSCPTRAGSRATACRARRRSWRRRR